MILYQNHPTERWSPERIREYSQYCWQSTFDLEQLGDLELRSLLNELVGLGVLAEDGEFYRMRSSLIPQMFGSKIEIERALKRLEAKEPSDIPTINQ